jgi:LacI family transcriptional regulator
MVQKRKGQQPRRDVCLLVHTSNDWGRQVLQGVAAYANERGHWDFHIEPRGIFERLGLPNDWQGDGVITRLTHKGLAAALRRAKVPVVNVSWLGQHSQTAPKVVSDEVATSRLAAEHFLDKGFESLGYVGPVHELGYADTLGKEFARVVAARGLPCAVFKSEHAAKDGRARLRRWLKRIPRPAGIFVWDSVIGREVTAQCAALKIRVPDEVAIVCSEHDPLISSMATVPLSNIDQAPTRVGYEAAALLDRMMDGEPAPKQPILIPPIGVVHRQSSDTAAVDDPIVAEALAFIRNHLSEPIQVIDLEHRLGLSRRVIEYRFSKVIGRSPAAEIRRARLERARRLLVETDLPIGKIAPLAGFNHPEVFIRAFQREIGMSPGDFRRSR